MGAWGLGGADWIASAIAFFLEVMSDVGECRKRVNGTVAGRVFYRCFRSEG